MSKALCHFIYVPVFLVEEIQMTDMTDSAWH